MQTLQDLVDSLSRRLRCAVSLDDRPLNMMFHSCLYGRLDEARIRRMLAPDRGPEPEVTRHIRECVQPVAPVRAPLRIPPKPSLGVGSRIYLPIRLEEEALGTLMVFDPDYVIGEAEIPAIVRAAAHAAQIIRYERILWDPDRSREHDVLAAILYGDEETAERAGKEAQRTGLLEPGPAIAIAASFVDDSPDASSGLELSEIAEDIRAGFAPGHCLIVVNAGEVDIVVSMNEPAIQKEGIAAIGPRLMQGVPGRTRFGIGDARPSLRQARESLAEARHALRLARSDCFSPATAWSDLGALRLVLQVPDRWLAEHQLVPQLEELMFSQPVLYRTLECFLRNAGQTQKTASELFIHRATLHYRLRKVEELTHRSLDSGEDRLALHLALKAAFLKQLPNP